MLQQLLLIIYAIVISFAPSMAWLVFVLKKDIHPERVRDISLVFVIGILSAVPVLLVGFQLQGIFEYLGLTSNNWQTVLMTGAITEEIIKALLLYFFAITAQFWDEPIDVFIYAATIGLGFAAIENFAVVVTRFESLGEGVELLIALRAFTAVLVHMISSFFFAYAIAAYKDSRNILVLFTGAIASIGFHGLYNYAVSLIGVDTQVFQLFYLMVFIPMFIYMLRIVKTLQKVSRVETI
jgi:RsiW-degrading membrane proteinase PrsW (M82 family)